MHMLNVIFERFDMHLPWERVLTHLFMPLFLDMLLNDMILCVYYMVVLLKMSWFNTGISQFYILVSISITHLL